MLCSSSESILTRTSTFSGFVHEFQIDSIALKRDLHLDRDGIRKDTRGLTGGELKMFISRKAVVHLSNRDLEFRNEETVLLPRF